jgi:hypothetical protein
MMLGVGITPTIRQPESKNMVRPAAAAVVMHDGRADHYGWRTGHDDTWLRLCYGANADHLRREARVNGWRLHSDGLWRRGDRNGGDRQVNARGARQSALG